MTRNEYFKNLGFIDEEEFQLYKDVCCNDIDVGGVKSFEELLDELLHEHHEPSKKDYELYIKDNNLTDLLNEVKDLSLFNRLLVIHNYNANCMSILNLIVKKYLNDIEEAKELFDGEKEEELHNRLIKNLNSQTHFLSALVYIRQQTGRLSHEEQTKFYESINVYRGIIYDQGDNLGEFHFKK